MKNLIPWFVDNPIAANMLMILILVGGYSSLGRLDKEVFPAAGVELVNITIPYPGAGPKDVEEQLCIRVEEAIADLNGIKEIRSTAYENLASITVEVITGYDAQKLLNDIKTRIDAINAFPEDAERAQVSSALIRSPLMSLALHGDVDEKRLKHHAKKIRDALSLLPSVNQVDIHAIREDEISIEVSQFTLKQFNLRLSDIANKIRQYSINLPAGRIRSKEGDMQIQTRGQAYRQHEFAIIPIINQPNGIELKLRDIATINDSFEEKDIIARFNGEPAVFLNLYMTDRPNILTATNAVKNYLMQTNTMLPTGLSISISRDWSVLFTGRMNLLLKNALTGLALVFIILMLFLRPALSFWVCIGIATAFMGAIWLLPATGISFNMISMFAFILVLGIVVDDAIIVGESIYASQQKGLNGPHAAAQGAGAVSKPVLFAVSSTMIFFAPMLVLPGVLGSIAKSIPVVVLLCLFFSLLESLLILPSHLSHIKPEKPSRFVLINYTNRLRQRLAKSLQAFCQTHFKRMLIRALSHSGATVALFCGLFLLSVAYFAGGWIKRSFMPIVPSDFIRLHIQLAEGSPFSEITELANHVESSIQRLSADAALNSKNKQKPFIQNVQTRTENHHIYTTIAMVSAENRVISVAESSETWRKYLGALPQAEQFTLRYTINTIGEDIHLLVSLYDGSPEDLKAVIYKIKNVLQAYPGVHDIKDSFEAVRHEVEISLKPTANTLGIALSDVAKQVRQGFYGEEVQRVARDGEDVKVMIRFPRHERSNYAFIDNMHIRTEQGQDIALTEIANITIVPAYTSITRENRLRVYTITAEVDEAKNNSELIIQELFSHHLEDWQTQYSGLSMALGGDKRDEIEFIDNVSKNFILALILIYGLMAVAFRSYSEPFLILTAVPFGFMGAIIGHIIMGREVSMLSLLGFLACAGVVVNDNLVLLDRINTLRREGFTAWQSALQAAQDRFRPIVLTSITTFVGLLPMMAERSTQAQFLVPMAISLSFGVLFATAVTLILVPCLYYAGTRLHHYVMFFLEKAIQSMQR